MLSQKLNKAISEYKEKSWKIYFKLINDDPDNPPVEDIHLSVIITESHVASVLADQGNLPSEFLFLDLEMLAAELEYPELDSISNCTGVSKVCRLSNDWNGHPKGKLAIATFAPDSISKLNTSPIGCCHLWLVEN